MDTGTQTIEQAIRNAILLLGSQAAGHTILARVHKAHTAYSTLTVLGALNRMKAQGTVGVGPDGVYHLGAVTASLRTVAGAVTVRAKSERTITTGVYEGTGYTQEDE